MANKQSAIKHMRSSKRKQARNRIYRGQTRTAVKKARHKIEQGHLEEAREAVRVAVVALDKAAQKGVIHKNNAARRKSRLMQQLNKVERAA
ncbi:MAG: 30S ribosomal protein S20 [Chloroflexi bacterium]|nr:MAG: 30S ribosomal protein S20 [Anaerolineaceae bacterium 4572_32.2]RLC76050.1 MAG: 30S ribosomal protein S20 [Chloroflexota bacterium]RLC83937.1 MAG: 30S ribosomal protein S20 [Chloroflexota bacterium]HEY72933.1 30S ribosomal protein S20 [Thermoflexia bacterium]